MKVLNILRSRASYSTIALVIYYYFLWQLDHHVAPLVWIWKGKLYADGWWLEYIIGKEPFEITNFYNICMVFLIISPLIVYLAWSIPYIKKRLRKNVTEL